MQPETKKTDWNAVSITLLLGLILILALGVVASYFGYQLFNDNKNTVNSQIKDLQTQVDTLESEQETAIAGITVDWKTYTNSKYGFSFRYPTSETLTEGAVNYGDAREYSISSNDNYLYVDVFNIGDQSPEDFVADFYGLVESGPSNIETVTINGYQVVKFTMDLTSASGTNEAGGVYFFSQGGMGVAVSNGVSQTDVGILPFVAETFIFE